MKDPIFPYMVQFYDKEFHPVEDSDYGFNGTFFTAARSPEEAIGKALVFLENTYYFNENAEICPGCTRVEQVKFTLDEDDSKYQIKLEEKVQEETQPDSE